MKKLTVVLLIALLALVMASCDRSNAPGEGGLPPVGESGSPEGTYTFSFKEYWCDSTNMELTFSGDSVSVTRRDYTDTYNYVKWEDIYHYVGSYSLDGSGNIVIDVNQATQKSEFHGSEENVAEYIAEQKYYNTIAFEDDNEITQQEYDKMMALLAGETVDLDAANISLTVRLDTENEKFYLIEVNQGNDEPKWNFTYYENGTVKTLKEDWGNSEIEVIEYDENGNAIADDDTLYEYDEQGRIVVHEFVKDGGIYKTRFEQEFNEDGVCILRKEYHYYNDELEMYFESKQLTYLTIREISYDFESYTFEDKKIKWISDYWNGFIKLKGIEFLYDESGEVYEYILSERDESKKSFDVDELNIISEKTYDGQGVLKGAVYYNYNDESNIISEKTYDGQGVLKESIFYEYYENGNQIKNRTHTYDENGNQIVECYTYDENGNHIKIECDTYDENGNQIERVICTYHENGYVAESVTYTYDENGNQIVEYCTYDENGNQIKREIYTYDENE